MSIVLDMDETLLHVFTNLVYLDDLNFETTLQTFQVNSLDGKQMWGVYRPGLGEFLKYITENFENVFVWSAGTRAYVEPIIKSVFSFYDVPMPTMILSRGHCRYLNGKYHKPLIDLKIFWNIEQNKNLDIRRTLIVDDRNYTFLMNPYNALQIPPFHPGGDDRNNVDILDIYDTDDRELFRLIQWFDEVNIKDSPDFTAIKKLWKVGYGY